MAALHAGDDGETPPDIRPHLRDLKSGRWILLDSGATASVFPRAASAKSAPDAVPALKAANGTPITTYGKRTLKIQVGKNHHLAVNCFLADVKTPILGWDWMAANDIEVRHHHVKGVGRQYYLPINGKKVHLAMAKPKAAVGIHADNAVTVAATRDSYQLWSQQQLVRSTAAAAKKPVPKRYQRLLADYPDIGTPNFQATPHTNHTIDTGDSKPCTAKVRPLTKGSRKYNLGKKALEELVQLGVAKRLANDVSPVWTSALHLQVKADGSLRPCGDYRLLNQRTHLDSYPLPNLAAFAANLSGAKWFAKCDLTKAYYNVGLGRNPPSRRPSSPSGALTGSPGSPWD